MGVQSCRCHGAGGDAGVHTVSLTHTYTLHAVVLIIQVALRGNGCAELWPACLQAVLYTDPTVCRWERYLKAP